MKTILISFLKRIKLKYRELNNLFPQFQETLGGERGHLFPDHQAGFCLPLRVQQIHNGYLRWLLSHLHTLAGGHTESWQH